VKAKRQGEESRKRGKGEEEKMGRKEEEEEGRKEREEPLRKEKGRTTPPEDAHMVCPPLLLPLFRERVLH
jgi:hypothetical protein